MFIYKNVYIFICRNKRNSVRQRPWYIISHFHGADNSRSITSVRTINKTGIGIHSNRSYIPFHITQPLISVCNRNYAIPFAGDRCACTTIGRSKFVGRLQWHDSLFSFLNIHNQLRGITWEVETCLALIYLSKWKIFIFLLTADKQIIYIVWQPGNALVNLKLWSRLHRWIDLEAYRYKDENGSSIFWMIIIIRTQHLKTPNRLQLFLYSFHT